MGPPEPLRGPPGSCDQSENIAVATGYLGNVGLDPPTPSQQALLSLRENGPHGSKVQQHVLQDLNSGLSRRFTIPPVSPTVLPETSTCQATPNFCHHHNYRLLYYRSCEASWGCSTERNHRGNRCDDVRPLTRRNITYD